MVVASALFIVLPTIIAILVLIWWSTSGVLCPNLIVLCSGWGIPAPVPASVIVFVVSDCFYRVFLFCLCCFLYFWDCVAFALVSGRFTLFCSSLAPLFTFSPVLLLIYPRYVSPVFVFCAAVCSFVCPLKLRCNE